MTLPETSEHVEGTKSDPQPLESTTDTGNANRFVRLFGERVRYCDVESRWYVHDGCRWAPDETLLVADWMRQALQSIFEDAALAAGEGEAKELARWATKSLSSAARKAALECAKSDPRIAVHPADFDQGPYLLNCQNGTLDLQTGKLRPHDSGDLLRKVTAVPYISGARSKLWDRVIAEATGDPEFAAAFQRACGYSATGDTSEEVFFIMVGPTQAVKSTVCNAVDETLGDYSASVNPETWLERGQVGGTRGDLVELDGVRMAISAEASARNVMATALLKAFTGGDRITVRRVYERDRSLKPTAKVWLHTNQVPKMPDDDDAIWRRAVIFPFEHPPANPDPSIKATLCDVEQSGAAILAWIVEGFHEWQLCGLAVPEVVKHATLVVRLGMDPLRDFFDEGCCFDTDAWTSTGNLRDAYDRWRKRYGPTKVIGSKEWGVRLSAKGLDPSKRNGVRGWVGVRLADAEFVESTLGQGH